MTVAVSKLSEQDQQQRAALVERLFQAQIASLEMLSIYIGERLGLYRTLDREGPLTPIGLARAAGIHERYAREWLEQQAVAGLVAVETEGSAGAERAYRLPAGHAEVLLDADSVNYLAPLTWSIPGLADTLPALLEAYRSGGGVPYEAYGAEFRNSIASLNRPMFKNLLGTQWFPAVPALEPRLRADPPAQVADVGCGT